jgi:hypothetical protein
MKFALFCIVFVGVSLLAGTWLSFHPDDFLKFLPGMVDLFLLVAMVWRLRKQIQS